MFVHREEYFQTNDDDRQRVAGQADIIVAKRAMAAIGDVKLAWKKDFTRFCNAVQRPYDEFETYNRETF